MRRLEELYGGRIIFTSLDIDDPLNADFKAQLQFRAQPQWVLLGGDGQVLKTWFGRVSVEEFSAAFDEALK